MKKVALIHTVRQGYLSFADEIRRALPDVVVTNTLDDELAREAVEDGISPHLNNRLFYACKLAESSGADLIVCACTSMIPILDNVKPYLSVPIILIDDEMHRHAARAGSRVTIFATAESALIPTVEKFKKTVLETSAGEKSIRTLVCPEANQYMRAGDMETHDRMVLDAVRQIRDSDIVILSQYSITHLSREIEAICGCRVFGSGEYCIREIAGILNGKES